MIRHILSFIIVCCLGYASIVLVQQGNYFLSLFTTLPIGLVCVMENKK